MMAFRFFLNTFVNSICGWQFWFWFRCVLTTRVSLRGSRVPQLKYTLETTHNKEGIFKFKGNCGMDKKSVVEKKIYEEKAHKIVTRLAVESVSEESLISIVKYIEPYHYEEIVEERFLSKLCGYPICKKQIKNVCPSN